MWMNVFIIYCRIKSRGVFNSLLSLIQVLHCTENFQMPKSPGSPVPGRRPPTLESFTQGPWTFDTVKVKLTTHLQMLPQTFCSLKWSFPVAHPDLWGCRHPVWSAHSSPPSWYALPPKQIEGVSHPGGYSTLGLDVDLKLSIYNWRPEGFIDFKVLNIGDTSEWSVHWIQPCRSTEKGLWKTTHCLYWWSDCTVKYCTYWQADPFGHCTLCHVHSALCTHHITRWKTLLLGCS